jgi:hypothetical protein
LGAKTNDLPCNDSIFLRLHGNGELNFTVNCRSNDVIWGAYGANVVQFSTLFEYIYLKALFTPYRASNALDKVKRFRYTQISHSYHVYTDTEQGRSQNLYQKLTEPTARFNRNSHMLYKPIGLFRSELDGHDFDAITLELMNILAEVTDFNVLLSEVAKLRKISNSAFYNYVVFPMIALWSLHKIEPKQKSTAEVAVRTHDYASGPDWFLAQTDWHAAGIQYISRRRTARVV